MAALTYLIIIVSLSIYYCNAYKILVVTQMPSKSHSILNDGIVKQLLKDGNEVTYIRSIEYKDAPPSLRQIDVSSNEEALPASAINIKAIMENPDDSNDQELARSMMINASINTLENRDVQKLISDPNEYFDVVIVEFIENDLLASFATVFNCPLIWMSPIEVNSEILSRIDAAPNPAYVADILSTNMPPFSFRQRLQELWYRINSQFLNYWHFNELQNEAYQRLVVPHIIKRGREPPLFDEVRYNASLVLGYSHVSMGQAAKLPQNFKPVGGYHIDHDVKPLPEALKKIMDNAKDGVIYFSMGSNLKSTDWPEDIKRNLLTMLGGLKQTVLWKFEEQLSNAPKNIYISQWYPQQSILSHPNCILFITHGGLLSTAESLHFGVPIIGIPAFGDQFVNIKRAATKGFGLKVSMDENVAENLKQGIEEMLSNPSYRQKVKELSFVYHDRPVKPNEVYIRHVIQTGGAPHLRSPAFYVPLYQRLYLDLVAIILVSLMINVKLSKLMFSAICSKKKPEIKKENKKKKNK